MKKLILSAVIFYFVLINFANSQEINGVALGDSLLNNGDLAGATIEYRKVYNINSKNSEASYSLACAFSLDRQTDSALKYLYIYISLDTSVYPLVEPDFLRTRENKEWEQFEEKLIQELSNKFNNPYKDVDYAKKLWKIQALDQAYYREMLIIEKKINPNSFVNSAIWDLKEPINKQNIKDLEELIEQKGWPKKSRVGTTATGSAFLVIQHSTTELQKKYLPIIKQLCEENEAEWSNYALMYDRIQTSDNKPQRYGSQLHYNEKTKSYELFPLEDENKVDEWRKEVGLGTLAEYVAQWGIIFSPKKK
jgi:hypothetical protein